jgi:ABC-type branched-subunit amino acid transport system substrate-binding protein
MRGTRKLIAMLLIGALIAVGCGGDDDDDDATGDAGSGEATEVQTDFGVTDDTIRIGLLADLSGPFAALVADIVVAQQAYFQRVNDDGGIAGRQVELVVDDTRYDVPTHAQFFQEMAAEDDTGVVMISQSTGSPHTANIAQSLVDDDLVAIPLSWYSGWADPTLGQNVLETYTNYCLEAMNGVQFMSDEGGQTVAIVSFPGEYGQDGAEGAKMAAEALGLEVVYDGEGAVTPPTATNPTPDNSAVAQEIVDANPDWVWATVNPSTLATLMGQAAARGFQGKWSGNSPSYNDLLLTSEVAELIDSSYWISTYTVTVGTDVPGMQDLIDTIQAYDPDARTSDAYVIGWTEAQIADAILRKAADNGDMTRAGVTQAAFEVDDIDFGGLAPAQSWQGEPNDYIVRESYIFKPVLADYNQAPLGEGSTGAELVEGPFASPLAQDYDFQGPCFSPEG